MANLTELAQALVELDEERVLELVEQKIGAGEPALNIIQECNAGMARIGERFEAGEYFLSELIFSGEILQNVMSKLEPLLVQAEKGDSRGTVVIGTVKGDIHDIGKNIVVTLLKGAGFDVVDLGVDVPTEAFVEKVRETGAKVLGMSALLSFTFPEMKTVIDALKAAGLRDQVTVIIGGAPCNEQVREFTGADYYAIDAVTGVNICRKVYG
ncbi:MAG: corrinoid protein [Syntrophothermus sp.]|uniref:cobalamin B12-binding domain-containing protein n=1 Tax=Syntrophothermus sp. TaxID=2736299 RepID=UPI00257A1E20|nr:corrinoid protein [Syntrophothermus sp.]NSW84284.1 corrinoid protein [Syntrophothermus sp.]NSW84286.1 corrinoid protein [Syntrophothermus sp.]